MPPPPRHSLHAIRSVTALPTARARPWLVLLIATIGTFMAILDSSIVNIALAHIMAAFHASVDDIEWIMSAYMIAFAVSIPVTAALRDRFGAKRVYLFGLALFTAGSLLCSVAWNLVSLVGFRVVQALGSGILVPASLVMITEAFPPTERGRAIGWWGIGAMLAPAVGPVLGGLLVQSVGWRSIFYLNLPVGGLNLWLARRWLAPDAPPPHHQTFDWLGLAGFSTALISLLTVFSRIHEWGWSSPDAVRCYLLGLAGAALFGWIELRHPAPLMDLRIFRRRNFALTIALTFIRAFALFGSVFLLPLYLQTLLGYSPAMTGLLMLPFAVCVGLLMPLGGRLVDRIGPQVPVSIGTALTAWSLYLYRGLGASGSIGLVLIGQVLRGIGIGLAAAPVTSAAVSAVSPRRRGVASGLLNITMQVGGAFGIAVLGTIYHWQEGWLMRAHQLAPTVASIQAFQQVFVVASAITLTCLVPALLLDNRAHLHGVAQEQAVLVE